MERGTNLALELKCQIEKKIFERRDTDTVSLMRYLFEPHSLHSREGNVEFRILIRAKIIDVAKSLLDRLFPLLNVDEQAKNWRMKMRWTKFFL